MSLRVDGQTDIRTDYTRATRLLSVRFEIRRVPRSNGSNWALLEAGGRRGAARAHPADTLGASVCTPRRCYISMYIDSAFRICRSAASEVARRAPIVSGNFYRGEFFRASASPAMFLDRSRSIPSLIRAHSQPYPNCKPPEDQDSGVSSFETADPPRGLLPNGVLAIRNYEITKEYSTGKKRQPCVPVKRTLRETALLGTFPL